MADNECDGLVSVIKEQGDLIRSLKLNSAPKEQVTDALYVLVYMYMLCIFHLHVVLAREDDATVTYNTV